MIRFRTLLKNWKLANIAVFSLSIALALGVFGLGISNWILLRPPAAVDPGRLVSIYHRSPESAAEQISYPDYKEYRDRNTVFSGLAAFPTYISKFWVEDRGEALGEVVSDNYFSVMGMKPALGRLFSPGADKKRYRKWSSLMPVGSAGAPIPTSQGRRWRLTMASPSWASRRKSLRE